MRVAASAFPMKFHMFQKQLSSKNSGPAPGIVRPVAGGGRCCLPAAELSLFAAVSLFQCVCTWPRPAGRGRRQTPPRPSGVRCSAGRRPYWSRPRPRHRRCCRRCPSCCGGSSSPRSHLPAVKPPARVGIGSVSLSGMPALASCGRPRRMVQQQPDRGCVSAPCSKASSRLLAGAMQTK